MPQYVFCYVGLILDLAVFQFKLKTMNIRNYEECCLKTTLSLFKIT